MSQQTTHSLPAAAIWGEGSERPPLGRPLLIGLAAIAVFFGLFGGWAVFAELSSAAVAPGAIRAESHRKTVQHLEGGIIRTIAVKEGQWVKAGQPLIYLDDTQTSAMADLVGDGYAALRAQEARLVAERDGLERIAFPQELLARSGDPDIAKILKGQQMQFRARGADLGGQMAVLEQKTAQLRAQVSAYEAQLQASDRQMRLVEEELETTKGLLEKGLTTKPRYLALERALAQLQGQRGDQAAQIARTREAIAEAQLQRANLGRSETKDVTAELRDVQNRLMEIGDRVRSASDIQQRTVITAPQTGRATNLRFVTPGGVIRPGEPVVDIVPTGEELVIDAKVSPLDIDSVRSGLKAEVRLPALHQRGLPILEGQVQSVSADALTDPRTGETYYVAQVSLPTTQLPKATRSSLQPGMPAEVFIVTGKRRPISYLTEPFRDSFGRAMRED
ncbi:HlyD family type I secretion periplasmic adaptor subunit [Phenylobacterium sp.]|jgi:HlyD family type I secretion membrane fusion protein|uniref:HlyD family type I secretion periplasmic adaptor subunit n=1 Tax=Phenylobacterium sp. TaxID=1871053 RepID=UPI002F9390DC